MPGLVSQDRATILELQTTTTVPNHSSTTQSAHAAIIGGGLAGLSVAILLAKAGHKVVLFERKAYPFHRVCGEYISLESWPFLADLGLDLEAWQLPIIKRLRVTDVAGRAVKATLPLGGFGVSRYKLDEALWQRALALGVHVVHTRVTDVVAQEAGSAVITDAGTWQAHLVLGAFGKRSNLDLTWKRDFAMVAAEIRSPYHNYIGVKWHLEADLAPDLIELHNFPDGYAGISAIEEGKYCFCYLTTAANLQKSGSVEAMEANILAQNPVLKQYLGHYKKLWPQPQTIAQVSFAPKTAVENGIWMLGDAAGMIAPLCGNGMSMALHGAALAAPLAHELLTVAKEGSLTTTKRQALEQRYAQVWRSQFNARLWTGRNIQALFGKPWLTALAVGSFRLMPWALPPLIGLTHGQPFHAPELR